MRGVLYVNLTHSKQSGRRRLRSSFRALCAARSAHSPAFSRPRAGDTMEMRRFMVEKEAKNGQKKHGAPRSSQLRKEHREDGGPVRGKRWLASPFLRSSLFQAPPSSRAGAESERSRRVPVGTRVRSFRGKERGALESALEGSRGKTKR